jgi:hypothetical protein
MVRNFLNGSLTWNDIYRPHNQNRPVVLNILLLASAQLDHFNMKRLQYLSVCFVVATFVLLAIRSQGLFRGRPGVLAGVLSFVAILLFSLAQWENLLLPIDVVFFSAITFMAAAILAMERHLGSGRTLSVDLLAAIVLSELAMFCTGGGVVVWCVNLGQILLSRALFRWRIGGTLLVYGGAAFVSLAVYSHGLGTSVDLAVALSRPEEFLRFVLTGFGNSIVGFWYNEPLLEMALVVGAGLTLAYGLATVMFFRLDAAGQQRCLGIFCLLVSGVAMQVLIALGRLKLGSAAAATSRYSTLTLISVPAVLILLAYCADRSRICAAMAVLVVLEIGVFAALANYSEAIVMAKARHHYYENLQGILRRGQFDEASLQALEWPIAGDIQSGNLILRQHRLSFYHNDPVGP